MRFAYAWLRAVIGDGPKRLAVGLGLMVLPVWAFIPPSEAVQLPPTLPKPNKVSKTADPRIERLKYFFSRLHCPVSSMADEFVRAADENHLDWRLLPSISVIESGGGKAYKNNNIFGWANGTTAFASIRSGIQEVAYKLGRSPLYRGHDSAGKLRIYNPDTRYVQNVMTVMNRISPDPRNANYALSAN